MDFENNLNRLGQDPAAAYDEAFRTPEVFAPVIPVPLDAPSHRRPLAYLGRELAA